MTWFVLTEPAPVYLRGGLDLIIGLDHGDGSVSIMHPPTLTKIEFDGRRRDPLPRFLTSRDTTGFLQAAMDAAWDAGLRPSRAQDEKHLKAHLEDMRTLAFHAIGVPK